MIKNEKHGSTKAKEWRLGDRELKISCFSATLYYFFIWHIYIDGDIKPTKRLTGWLKMTNLKTNILVTQD